MCLGAGRNPGENVSRKPGNKETAGQIKKKKKKGTVGTPVTMTHMRAHTHTLSV